MYALYLIAALVLFTHSQGLPATQQDSALSAIAGLALDASTSEPIAAVEIALSKIPDATETSALVLPPAINLLTTDTAGRFSFVGLVPGSYVLRVTAANHVLSAGNLTSSGTRVLSLTVSAREKLNDLRIRLIKEAKIHGRITNHLNQPLVRAAVQLWRPVYDEFGKKTFQLNSSTETDDRGEYRLAGLLPGEYYLTGGGVVTVGARGGPRTLPPQSVNFRTYFPRTTDVEKAETLRLSSGAEYSADITIPVQEVYRLRGRIIDSQTGKPPSSIEMWVRHPVTFFENAQREYSLKYDASSGEFELLNVPPSSYILEVRALAVPFRALGPDDVNERRAMLANAPSAEVAITLGNGDLSGIEVVLTPSFSLGAQITVEGSNVVSGQISDAKVILTPLQHGRPTNVSVRSAYQVQQPTSSGDIELKNVRVGEYSITVKGLPSTLSVKEIRLDNNDILNRPFDLSGPSQERIRIVLTSTSASVSGTVVDSSHTPKPLTTVVMVPSDSRFRLDRYATTLTDTNGRFSFSGMAAGSYIVLAGQNEAAYGYFDSNRHQELLGKTMPIRVDLSTHLDLELTDLNSE
jgi:hypothetical protein